MKRIRSGRGLGDNLYMVSVVRHLISKGIELEVCTDFPEIFDGMPVAFAPHSRHNIKYLCHYTRRKTEKTNQWEDICITAGVKDVELRIDWKIKNQELIDEVKTQAEGKKILLVHGGRQPMGRQDNFGIELLPDYIVFNDVLDLFKDYFRVQIGSSKLLYTLNCDKNLNHQTSISDLLDIASIADGFYGQPSFIIPLAESFNKPLMVVWSEKGLNCSEPYIGTITPKKILSKNTSMFIVDDWTEEKIVETVNEFRQL